MAASLSARGDGAEGRRAPDYSVSLVPKEKGAVLKGLRFAFLPFHPRHSFPLYRTNHKVLDGEGVTMEWPVIHACWKILKRFPRIPWMYSSWSTLRSSKEGT